jgi:hypothetical protein
MESASCPTGGPGTVHTVTDEIPEKPRSVDSHVMGYGRPILVDSMLTRISSRCVPVEGNRQERVHESDIVASLEKN